MNPTFNTIRTITVTIVGMIILFFILNHFVFSPKIQAKQDAKLWELNHTIDSSQREIDRLKLSIAADNILILDLNKQNDSLRKHYTNQSGEIAKTDANLGKKDSVIAKYDVQQVEDSFAARYKQLPFIPDSIVRLSMRIGRAALTDLDHYDTIKKIIPMYVSLDNISRNIIANRDSTIAVQNHTIDKFKQTVLDYNIQTNALSNEIAESDKKNKQQKTKTTISQILAGLMFVLYILK